MSRPAAHSRLRIADGVLPAADGQVAPGADAAHPMNRDTLDWLDGLRTFAAEQRQTRPLADVARPTPALRAEWMLVATHFATRLAEHEAILAARRRWLAASGGPDGDPDPAIVLTTTSVGIAAAADWLAVDGPHQRAVAPRVVAVTELEYRLWCIRRPDEERHRHVNLWNWVKTRVPPERWPEFAAHPLADGETYWLHRTGTSGAGAADARRCSLWKFGGRHAALLAADIVERLGPRDRDDA